MRGKYEYLLWLRHQQWLNSGWHTLELNELDERMVHPRMHLKQCLAEGTCIVCGASASTVLLCSRHIDEKAAKFVEQVQFDLGEDESQVQSNTEVMLLRNNPNAVYFEVKRPRDEISHFQYIDFSYGGSVHSRASPGLVVIAERLMPNAEFQ